MTARKLVLSHMARAVRNNRRKAQTLKTAAANDAANDADDESRLPPLKPNQMRLYSYYKPSLAAGNYDIEVTQKVSSGSQSLEIQNTRTNDQSGGLAPQEFEVVVPRFTLDRNLVNSYYPPDGHQDEGRILPHISFNDPHFPWEVLAGTSATMTDPIDEDNLGLKRSFVPWVALLVLDPEDLRISDFSSIQGLGIPHVASQADLAKQGLTGTFSMTVSEYLAMIPASRVNYEQDTEGFARYKSMTDVMTAIFPSKKLLSQLLSADVGTASQKLDLEALKYMAHVRHINTLGFPEAGVEEEGLFSIVVSSRTGTWDSPDPKTQICHLISIEHFDTTIPRNRSWDTATDRIGVVSLFSWVYTSMPPNPVNFISTMKNLTENQQQLRINDSKIAEIESVPPNGVKYQASQILARRLRMGYAVSRWRTQAGEETAAFNRGPLVPVAMPTGSGPEDQSWPRELDMADCSNTSQNYQILDPETGFMDLSYSSAWQAGKLLAISDTVFNSALMRFRSSIHNSTSDRARMQLNGMLTRAKLAESIKNSVKFSQRMSTGEAGEPLRFRPMSTRQGHTTMRSSQKAVETFANQVHRQVEVNTRAGEDPFDDFNLTGPNNNDWAIIHNWLSEKLVLGGIPPQYLLPDASFLPAESLRYFYIDDFWLDCLLDGALSVANHLDSDDDNTRREIKKQYNNYLSNPVTDSGGIKPQIPCYGFIIRSKLIKAMPDLRITVKWKGVTGLDEPGKPHSVCRWTRWDDETLMALLDRLPQELESIRLAQPPHQKRFSLGDSITLDPNQTSGVKVAFQMRQLFTDGAPLWPANDDEEWPIRPVPVGQSSTWVNKTTRRLEITRMARELNQLLQKPDAYIDQMPNSVELGFELNDNCYYFDIFPPDSGIPPSGTDPPPRNRQLYVKAAPPVQPIRTALVPSDPIKPAMVARRAMTTSAVRPAPTAPLPRAPHAQLRIQPWPHGSSTQPMPSLASTFAAATTAAAAAATLQTRFDLSIFPDYRSPPTRYTQPKYAPTDYLATNNIYFYDMIFSVRKKPSATVSQYQLLKIVIDIPVATNPPNTAKEALLTPTYDGQGVRMLSNQRFVPFLFNDDPGEPLHVELVPRSADDGYAIMLNDRKTRELGFRLAEANISPVVVKTLVQIEGQQRRQERGLVEIKMTEWYSTPAFPRGEAVGDVYKLVKWDTRDDQEIP